MADQYHLTCRDVCSLKAGTAFGDTATRMLLEKATWQSIIDTAKAQGYNLNAATLGRHKKHIVIDVPDEEEAGAPRASNIEILETIIASGFKNRKNWKPTIGDTMKAMDMWFRLTQGNPFDELLNAMAAASIGAEDEGSDEAPAALGLPDEQEDDEE